jgi:DNA-binding transcriptional LysR family regulator
MRSVHQDIKGSYSRRVLDIHQLRVLSEIARVGSYTEAAKSLGYSQPALSYHMRCLERTLGVPLTVKVGRRAQLTDAAVRLAERADAVLGGLRAVEQEFRALAAEPSGTVRLSAIQSACTAVVPGAMARLRSTHPAVETVINQATCTDSYRLLRSGQTDLAIMCDLDTLDPTHQSVANSPGLLRIPLLTDRRCVLLPSDHPLAERPTLTLADLCEERWVLEPNRTRFLAGCAEAGFTPKVVATADEHVTVHCLVAGHVGVAAVDALGLLSQRDARVVVRPLDDWPTRHVFALLWPEMAKVPAVAALLEATQAEVKERFGTAAEHTDPQAGPLAGLVMSAPEAMQASDIQAPGAIEAAAS